MKLIGSKMESDFRKQLVASNQGLVSTDSRLGQAIRSRGHRVENAYVLHWIPDQTEEISLVLVEGNKLLSVELSTIDPSAPPVFEQITLNKYKHGLSRMNQVKLAVAQELANEEHNKRTI